MKMRKKIISLILQDFFSFLILRFSLLKILLLGGLFDRHSRQILAAAVALFLLVPSADACCLRTFSQTRMKYIVGMNNKEELAV
jgi:hypothetical protein